MERPANAEETLRVQFGTAATAVGAQWYATEQANGGHAGLHRSDGRPRVIAFEAKGRVQRPVSMTSAVHRALPNDIPPQREEASAWGGSVQVYDQSASVDAPSNTAVSSACWDWHSFSEMNLFEVDEFRPHMALHNFYEGQRHSRGGSLSTATLDAMEDRLRGELEHCDQLRNVQAIVDVDSAWGGVANEALTYLKEECVSAVMTTVATDWAYPLASQLEESIYASAGPTNRDQTKVRARRRINLASSMAALVDCSSMVIPVAMAPSARQASSSTDLDEACMLETASTVATALEIALSVFHRLPHSVYELLESMVPSMPVLELTACCPLSLNPALLVCGEEHLSAPQLAERRAVWEPSSLLPHWQTTKARKEMIIPPRFRRLHLRGRFERYSPALRTAMDRYESQDCVVTWSPEAVQRVDAHVESSVSEEGAAQLALSAATGGYLSQLAAQINDRRIQYEFTQAGMNVDYPEELLATLKGYADAYPRVSTTTSDDK